MYVQVKPLHIDYARTAKRLDVKRLKAKMWEVITESAEDMKENMVRQSFLIGASLSKPHMDQKDVRESYIYGTSVTYARNLIFNIHGRPRKKKHSPHNSANKKHCEHVDDKQRWRRLQGGLRRERERAKLVSLS